MSNSERVLVWFSCGAASAVAAKLAIEKYQDRTVLIIYCDTSKDEDEDNQRFARDVSEWLNKPILKIKSKKYSSIDDVYEKTRYMSGIAGARCTVEMKKVPRFNFQRADDVHVFGLCADEEDRIFRFSQNNPDLYLDWILRDKGKTKEDCFSMLQDAEIKRPRIYDYGFNNANCKCCVKATSPKYWNLSRKHFPDVFEERATRSRKLGVKLVRLKGKRIFLDELPADAGLKRGKLEDIECGPQCSGGAR